MTENDETSPCCFEETCSRSKQLRVCTARDYNRNDCSKNVAVKEHFITLMTFPQGLIRNPAGSQALRFLVNFNLET